MNQHLTLAPFIGLVVGAAHAIIVPIAWPSPAQQLSPTPAVLEPAVTDDVRVRVELIGKESEFEILEPIAVQVVAANLSEERLSLPPAGYPPLAHYRMFRFHVFDAKNQPVPWTRFGGIDVKHGSWPVGGSISPGIPLDPGEERHQELVVNRVRDMTSPGEYTIVVDCPIDDNQPFNWETPTLVARSRPIRVRVLPEEPKLPNMPRSAKRDAP